MKKDTWQLHTQDHSGSSLAMDEAPAAWYMYMDSAKQKGAALRCSSPAGEQLTLIAGEVGECDLPRSSPATPHMPGREPARPCGCMATVPCPQDSAVRARPAEVAPLR